jgi:hypothetical protein
MAQQSTASRGGAEKIGRGIRKREEYLLHRHFQGGGCPVRNTLYPHIVSAILTVLVTASSQEQEKEGCQAAQSAEPRAVLYRHSQTTAQFTNSTVKIVTSALRPRKGRKKASIPRTCKLAANNSKRINRSKRSRMLAT